VEDGLDLTDDVSAKLQPLLAGQGLGVDEIKANAIDDAETFAQIFTGLFLVLGLFSIAVGILLIVLIFTMLAAERRSEMGMARAIGAHRRQLIQQFIAEGSGYAILAGLVGAALGVVATVAIALTINALFGEFLEIEPSVSPRSLVIAYCLGVVITFIAVVGSSWKISRLKRRRRRPRHPRRQQPHPQAPHAGLGRPPRPRRRRPPPPRPRHRAARLVHLRHEPDPLRPRPGPPLLRRPGAPRLHRRRRLPARRLLMPDDLFIDIFGEYSSNFEMFFVSGIFMVLAGDDRHRQQPRLPPRRASAPRPAPSSPAPSPPSPASASASPGVAAPRATSSTCSGGRPRRRRRPPRPRPARPAAGPLPRQHPPRRPHRHRLPRRRQGPDRDDDRHVQPDRLLLVTFATINQNFVELFLGDEANAGWDVRADALRANPIGDAADFRTLVESRGVDTSQFEATGLVATGADESRLRVAGAAGSGVEGLSGPRHGPRLHRRERAPLPGPGRGLRR
jgi:hypothetical protein